jgi:hypothetical protein
MMERAPNKIEGRRFGAAVAALEAYAAGTAEAPPELLIKAGTITKEGLRKLTPFLFESSLRDRGEDLVLAAGTEDRAGDFEGTPGSAKFQLGANFNYEFETSKTPFHTHPVLHFPSLQDIESKDFGQIAHVTNRDRGASQYKLAWIATTRGVIAYRRATDEEYERIKYKTKVLAADNPEIFEEHSSAFRKKDFLNPAHAQVAELMLAMMQEVGVVLADISWDDPRADLLVDILNRKRTPEEVLGLLKDD